MEAASMLLSIPHGIRAACWQRVEEEISLRKVACACRTFLVELNNPELWAAPHLIEVLPARQWERTLSNDARRPHLPFFTEATVKNLLQLVVHDVRRSIAEQAISLLSTRARHFGLGILFDEMLPLWMDEVIAAQCGARLVSLMSELIDELQDQITPFVYKILVVTEGVMVAGEKFDGDPTRGDAHRLIGELSSAVGLARILAIMRPDISHSNTYVREATANGLLAVAHAQGVSSILLFLKAVCKSKKWETRCTGIMVVQHIAVDMAGGAAPENALHNAAQNCVCNGQFKHRYSRVQEVCEKEDREQILDSLVEMASYSLQETDVKDVACTCTWPYMTLHGYARAALAALAHARAQLQLEDEA